MNLQGFEATNGGPKMQVETAGPRGGVCAALGALPEGAIISEDGLAGMMGKCRMSIRRAVKRGELPQPARLMGKRIWTAGTIIRHMESALERAKQEGQRRERRLSQLPA
jgi:hypothetical protein